MNLKRWGLKPLALLGAITLAITAMAIVNGQPATTFRVAHLSPNAPAVDVYVDGVLYEKGMTFGQIGTTHAPGKSGEMLVEVRLAGTAPTTVPLISAMVNLRPGWRYVLQVSNYLEYLQIAAMPIHIQTIPAAMGRLEVIHAFPGAPRIDVVNQYSQTVINDLGYLEDPPMVDALSGPYRLLIYEETPERHLYYDQTISLEEGANHTLIIAGPPLRTLWLTTRQETLSGP